MHRVPNLSAQEGIGGIDTNPDYLDNEIARDVAYAHRIRTGVEDRDHRPYVTSGIAGADPRNLHESIEDAAAREAASSGKSCP